MLGFFLIALVGNTDGQATTCDSTCFFLPVGALGCAISDTLFPPATRKGYTCINWVDLVVLGVNLGQICVSLSPTGETPVIAKRTGINPVENMALSRGERRSFEISESRRGDMATSRQSSVETSFADSKLVCQEDLGGSLLNFNEMVPSSECGDKFLAFKQLFGGTSISEVIEDTGPTQNQLASLLDGKTFFVDAAKHPSISYLYKYAEITDSPLNVHHLVMPKGGNNQGGCLSAAASDGQLQFSGTDCDDQGFPLCFRTFANLTEGINLACSQADCGSANFQCQKWVSLGKNKTSTTVETFQSVDGFNYFIEDAEICLEPCNVNEGKTTWYDGQMACEDMNGTLLSFKNFVNNKTEAANFLNASGPTACYNASGVTICAMPTSGPIQNLLASILASNGVTDTFYVNANQSISSAYLYGENDFDVGQDFDFLEQLTSLESDQDETIQNCLTMTQNGEIIDLSGSAGQKALIFEGLSCLAQLKPLCIKGSATVQPSSEPQRLKWKQQVGKNKKIQHKKKSSKSNVPNKVEGRQVVEGNPDYCLAILPIVGIGALLLPTESLAAVRPQVIQPPPAPNPQPLEPLNTIEDFGTFMTTYNRVYPSAAEAAFRQTIFLQNLATIQLQNQLFVSGLATYFLRVNRYSDMTFEEFGSLYLGLGLFNTTGVFILPRASTRGSLRQDIPSPASLDLTTSGCITSVKTQLCNSCAAHATTAAVEYCLCAASGQLPESRSVQQISECTDGRGLDVGSPIERVNTHCVTGFPDVHLDFVIKELNGNIDAASNNEESESNKGCNRFSRDFTSARVVDYVSDIFTDEEHLVDAVSQIGPTATNIAVTPKIQSYGGGVYYNADECTDYAFETVPSECVEERNGRMSYTCLENNGVKCSELLPLHCNIFFVPSETSFPHSLTATGYGQDSDGTLFWKMKNSWGEDWGEGGFLRIARGLGHCGVGSMYTVPECRVG